MLITISQNQYMKIGVDEMKQNNKVDIFQIIRRGTLEEFNLNIDSFDINLVDEYGYSMLHEAISYNKYEICDILIERGIDVNIRDKNGKTALQYVLSDKNEESHYLVDILLANGARLDIEDNYGNQALWTAVLNAKIPLEIIDNLLKKGADPLHKNKAGRSPYDMVLNYDIKELTDIFEPYV